MTKSIDEMYAFVALDPEDDTEGIPAFRGPGGMVMPMVGADMDRANALRKMAQDLATQQDMTITLVKFTVREELEVFEP